MKMRQGSQIKDMHTMPAEASSLSDVRWQAVGVGWLDNGSRNMDDDGGLS